MEQHGIQVSANSMGINTDSTNETEGTKKTILFLGASPQQLAPIKQAKQVGFKIITCDNRPTNPGHQLAHKSYDISTTDLEAVCRMASDETVDAIIAYGTDVGAPTAAWVAERLGLHGNQYNAVTTLTDKGKFRQFQRKYGFFAPNFLILNQEQLKNQVNLQKQIIDNLKFPLIIKPVDASGGRGISRVHSIEQLSQALALASKHTRSGDIVIEELVQYLGYQICGEGFLHNGNIVFHAFADEHFAPDVSPPIGETFPCTASAEQIQLGVATLQNIFSKLGMLTGPFNFDLVYLTTGEVFIIEIGPRNGGNRMPEAIFEAHGVDMIAATIQAALGEDVNLKPQWSRQSATYSIHSKKSGVLRSIEYNEAILPHIVSKQIFVDPGEKVQKFSQGGDMLGCLVLAFDNNKQMINAIQNMDELIKVQID